MCTSFFTVVPPFVISYLIYDAAEKEHDRLMRKQPGQFDHEELMEESLLSSHP